MDLKDKLFSKWTAMGVAAGVAAVGGLLYTAYKYETSKLEKEELEKVKNQDVEKTEVVQ